jgi:hypothetical protein
MANKVYNLNGGLYSGDAFTAFETRIASSNNGSIVASPSDLKVSAGSGMNVTVSTGAGIIGNGTLSGVRFAIDSPVTVAVNAASTANPRMDSVVAYIDKSVSASTSVVDNTDLGIVKFKSVAGTPASAPTAPSTATIQSSIGAGNPYMVLANITVPKSSTAASSFTITDTRVTPTSAIITDSSITTPKLANKAVTSDKVDWATLSHVSSVGPSSATSVYQTPITLNEVTIPKTGVYFASATVDPNVLGNDVGNSTVYLTLNSKNIAGAQVFFNSKSGMWFFGGCHVSAIISCSQGDKIQLRGECGQNHWEVGERRRLDAFRIG